ncbi:MAG: TonB-dependent siderophore receptor [Gammaproteobacteria bacterium]
MNGKLNCRFLVLALFAFQSMGVSGSPEDSAGPEPEAIEGQAPDSAGSQAEAKVPAEVPEEIEVRERSPYLDASESAAAIKARARLRELPLSVEVLPREVINDSQFRDFGSVLNSFTLTTAAPGERGLFEEIVLRGFTDASFYRDGLNDSNGVLPIRDLANVESIEILKGPNSAIYGTGEPGGSINFQTKKPQREPSFSLASGLDNHDRYRVEVDATGPLPDRADLAYRLIGAIEDSGSFRNFIDSRKLFAAPSVSWRANDRLDLLGSLEFIQYGAPFDSGVIAVDGAFPLPSSRFLGEPDIGTTNISAFTAALDGDYELNDAWRFSAALYWQDSDLDGLKVEPAELDDVDLSEPAAILIRELQDESIGAEVISTQLEFEGKFSFSGLENRVLLGYEFSSLESAEDILASDGEEEPYAIDIFDVEYGQPRPDLSPLVGVREATDQHSLYVQDYVKFGDHWRFLAGTRLDVIDTAGSNRIDDSNFNQKDDKFSSRLGIVYSPNSVISMFGSFSESMDPNEGLLPNGDPLKPTRGRAYEAGVKIAYPAMNATFDASVFNIEQTNVASDAPNAPGFEIQTGRQVSQGLDLELFLTPWEWAQLGLKYGYTDAELKDDPKIPHGTAPLNVPLHKFVFFGLFSFSLNREDDLKAGFSFVHASKRQASLDVEELSVKLPGYWTGNLFVDYAWSEHVDLGVDVSNVFDEDYFAGSQSDLLHITPGPPITVFSSIKIHF